MDDKLKEIERARVRARIEEMGYSIRGLSMKLFNKPDRIQNFLSGKSNKWLADTHNTIVEFLWPNENKSSSGVAEKERFEGLLSGLQMVIGAVIAKKVLNKQELEGLFNYQLREFRKRNQSLSAEVLDQLLDFLHSESFQTQPGEAPQSRQPQKDQSKSA